MKKVGDPLRDALGGSLREHLVEELESARDDGREVYAVLYELDDPELISLLLQLGKKAHIILANGSVKKKGLDQNKTARAKLKGKVSLFNRMVAPTALGHNKFLVICDKKDAPARVWTGSTNWTMTGLCTQANNAILLDDKKAATAYRKQWDLLQAVKDTWPETLVAANSNSKGKKFKLDGYDTTIWFTRTDDEQDMAEARGLINDAKDGVLFLMFNPGPAGTLLNAIIERASPASQNFDGNLYIHGAVNQDPSTTKTPVELFHRGSHVSAGFDVTLPAAVNAQLKFWRAELLKKHGARAMVHSKVIVIDPFGDAPVVMTGSHNLGPKASSKNDENLVIIEGHGRLAQAYATNIMAICNQYRWRFQAGKGGTPAWTGLADNDTWQDAYLSDPVKMREIKFWIPD